MRRTKQILALLIIHGIGLVTLSCCPFSEQQPTRPNDVLGWKAVRQASGTEVLCVLLLRKGETSENGNLGVRVVNIIPGEPCAHAGWQSLRKVELEFYRPADHHIYGHFINGTGGGLLELESEAGVTGIGIQAINSKDNWAMFNLMK